MKSKLLLSILSSAAFVLSVVQPVAAEELAELMKRVQDFAAEGNYAKAMDELSWVQKELEKMHLKKVEEYFPGEVAGYTGGEFSPNAAMGMSNLERVYSKEGEQVKVSLTGSSGSGNPLGGLAGLGKMAAMMGAQGTGMNTFRVDGRTASLNEQGNPELTVFLDSGSILQFSGGSAASLKSMAEAFNVGKLDNYLRGQG